MTREKPLARITKTLRPFFKRRTYGNIVLLGACAAIAYYSALSICEAFLPPAEPAFVAKLQNAEHIKMLPVTSWRRLADTAKYGWKVAVTNALGHEIRDISYVLSDEPQHVFLTLSLFSDYGEIVWIKGDWNRIHVTDASTMQRNAAVKTIITAIEKNGGCLIDAGPGRHLVIKKMERKQYEAALRELGWTRRPAWLVGSNPPWETNRLWNFNSRPNPH